MQIMKQHERTPGGVQGHTTHFLGERVSLWHDEPLFPGGGRVLEGQFQQVDGGLVLSIPCPRCGGGLTVRSSTKDMHRLPDGRLQVARFGCTWGPRSNPCGWSGVITPAPVLQPREDLPRLHGVIRS